MPLLDENSADMNPPLYFSRACSSDLLNLYFGDFVANEKNLIRLGKFLGRVVSYDDINKDIHPFG
jgi:hypothetical protein